MYTWHFILRDDTLDIKNNSRHFVLGCNDIIVDIDDKPILKVLGDRKMEDINISSTT